jgi:hypothetical protein
VLALLERAPLLMQSYGCGGYMVVYRRKGKAAC